MYLIWFWNDCYRKRTATNKKYLLSLPKHTYTLEFLIKEWKNGSLSLFLLFNSPGTVTRLCNSYFPFVVVISLSFLSFFFFLDCQAKHTNNTIHCFVLPPYCATAICAIVPETGTSRVKPSTILLHNYTGNNIFEWFP